MGMALSPPVYDPHAELRMRQRRITGEQVERVLRDHHTSHPAEPLRNSRFRSRIYVGTVDGRDLKVYIRDDSDPPYVTTVAWKDE